MPTSTEKSLNILNKPKLLATTGRQNRMDFFNPDLADETKQLKKSFDHLKSDAWFNIKVSNLFSERLMNMKRQCLANV